MDLITLKGTPAEIGHQHGELLQGQVRRVWDFYSKTLFNGQLAQLEEYGYRFLEVIRTFRSDYATEIIALAEGAGLASWQIAALNARTAVLQNLTDIDVGECTAMYFPGTRTLGVGARGAQPAHRPVHLPARVRQGAPLLRLVDAAAFCECRRAGQPESLLLL